MKIRTNFVSNSSSASFILDRYYLSEKELNKLLDYCKYECKDFWELEKRKDTLEGFTLMDNGDLFKWIKENLNIPFKAIISYDSTQ
jgi:hypothetical protein